MMKKIFSFLLAVLVCGTVVVSPAFATSGGCDKSFLGFKAWFNGLACENGMIVMDGTENGEGETVVSDYVLTIAGNIAYDLTLAIGYLTLAFVIYSGYMYLTSAGDVAQATKAKKTLLGAAIGAAISLSASAIINFLLGVLIS